MCTAQVINDSNEPIQIGDSDTRKERIKKDSSPGGRAGDLYTQKPCLRIRYELLSHKGKLRAKNLPELLLATPKAKNMFVGHFGVCQTGNNAR